MINYTIQQLECFFAIVECGNMSKASARLFTTQPSMSKTIQRLEEGLGFALFTRDVNKLTLTTEGEFFYLRAKPLYQQLSALILNVQNMSKGQSMLRIGYYPGCDVHVLKEAVQKFEALYPETVVLENIMGYRDLRDGLSMGKLDAIVSLSYAVKKIVDSKMMSISGTKLHIVMRDDNKMALERKLDFDLLNRSTWFFSTTIETQTFEQNDLRRCQEVGFMPKDVVYLENYESCLNAVRRGNGLCFSVCNETRDGLASIEIPWLRNTPELMVVWLEHNKNAALENFLAMFPASKET